MKENLNPQQGCCMCPFREVRTMRSLSLAMTESVLSGIAEEMAISLSNLVDPNCKEKTRALATMQKSINRIEDLAKRMQGEWESLERR